MYIPGRVLMFTLPLNRINNSPPTFSICSKQHAKAGKPQQTIAITRSAGLPEAWRLSYLLSLPGENFSIDVTKGSDPEPPQYAGPGYPLPPAPPMLRKARRRFRPLRHRLNLNEAKSSM